MEVVVFHLGRISLALVYVGLFRVVLFDEEQDTDVMPIRTAHKRSVNVLNKCERLFIGLRF